MILSDFALRTVKVGSVTIPSRPQSIRIVAPRFPSKLSTFLVRD